MKWFLQNSRQRAIFAIKNPRYVLRALLREVTLADEKFLSRLTGAEPRQIRAYLNEPPNTPGFGQHLLAVANQFQTLAIESADLFAKKILNQYAAVRALAPRCIVETGIANGVSSSYLLLAIQKNGFGELHSIGLSDPAYLPAGRNPGWLVPEWLREPWQIHLGDAREVLPGILANHKPIDVFIHDSLHTYEHMFWEYQTAFPALRPGGLLISDDALWNSAFHDFAAKVEAKDARILRGVGFLRKPAK